MSEFHPPIYCDNQDDFILVDNRCSSPVSSERDHNLCKSCQETTQAFRIILPEPKRRRTIEEIKKFDPIMSDFEKMIKKRKV